MTKVAPWLLAASIYLNSRYYWDPELFSWPYGKKPSQTLETPNWAKEAITQLGSKYLPEALVILASSYFITRPHWADTLNRIITAVGRDLARLGANSTTKSDLQILARLQEEFRQELAEINNISNIKTRLDWPEIHRQLITWKW